MPRSKPTNDPLTWDSAEIHRRAAQHRLEALKLMKTVLDRHILAIETTDDSSASTKDWEHEIFELTDNVKEILLSNCSPDAQADYKAQFHSARWSYGIDKDVEDRKVKAVIEIWQWLCAISGDHIPQEELNKIHLLAKLGDPI